MTTPERQAGPALTGGDGAWIVTVTFAFPVELPGVGPADQAGLGEWLWMRFGDAGLIGIDEGSIGVVEAAAAGLAGSPLVIDTAAAPADRDWVGMAAAGWLDLAFADERSCRAAVAVLEGIAAATALPRPAALPDVEPQRPVAIDGFGWILPPGIPPPDDAAAAGPGLVVIDAGIGFGTGLHATTRMCLRALASWAAGGRLDRVLDVGAGSGILGIAAAMLGATHVDAIEIDRGVHDAIRRNAAASGAAARIHVAETLAAAATGGHAPYDLVVANIVAGVLQDLAEDLVRLVAAGGVIILSGIRADESSTVAARYERLSGRTPLIATEDGWACLTLRG